MTGVLDISALRDAISATLKAKLPRVDVDAHGGTFDLDEVKRYAALAPAVRVALVGCGKASRWNDGRWLVPVNIACVIFARDAASADRSTIISRDTAALALATSVQIVIQGNRFGLSGVRQPEDVTARNEYSGALDATGAALWQVNFTCGVLLGEAVDETLAALAQLYIIEDSGPRVLLEAPP